MTAFPTSAEAADQRLNAGAVRYSICTLVTDPAEYCTLVESFEAGGFLAPECEYLYLDNSGGNRFDAYAGYNLFLTVAQGEYIILCHQDIELLADGRERLDAVLDELTRFDPAWGLCGNAGGIRPGRLALRICDPYGANTSYGGPFPRRVSSLDENFIVVRRSANLALSHDLSGFHLYGADICLIGAMLGVRAYVVDFFLRHKSPGNRKSEQFLDSRRRLIAKYQAALRSHWVMTTCTMFFLSGSRLRSAIANSWAGRKVAKNLGRFMDYFC